VTQIRRLLAVGLLVLFGGGALACGGGDAVRVATEGAYAPYNFINDDGEIDGFERELGDELCRRAGLDCTWVINDWDSTIPNLVNGDFEAVMAGMSITDERDEQIDFTQPYIPPSPSLYVALAGAGDAAATGVVAVQVATIQHDHLADANATMQEYETAPEAIAAVLAGEADAALVDSGFATENVAESGGQLALIGPEVPIDRGVGVGVQEGDDDLREKLDEAISEMKADGSLNALLRKWFGPDTATF
jgi:polar amino acid transport system substrate-binding protein